MRIVCYSEAGSALNETKVTAKTPTYSRFLVQVRFILILSDNVYKSGCKEYSEE